jgi:potassium efflux system protein
VSLFAAPVIGFATLFPAALAALGYYLTAVYGAYMLLQTLWLAVGLVVLNGVLQRWQAVGFRRRVSNDQSPATDELEQSQVKAKHLFRFVVVLVGAIGLYGVWGDSLTALHALKRVQLLPSLALLDEESQPAIAPLQPSAAVVPDTDTVGQSQETKESSGASNESPLTAWDVLLALLAVLATISLVRDVPGLVELLLNRRTRVDSGARVAASTLVRYSIMFGGLMLVSSLLGLSWSSVQWLAAALTVGLGFGLQEIVANFVSGLILLVERPVRVGDAVTMGNLSGRITRIRMRATTISLWDRSEMVVPNKEFITSKLVNWTLSDSRRRIEIPIRVQYGADVDKVKTTLLSIATAHPAVLEEPPPQVLLQEFTDDALRFELWIYVEFRQGLKTKDELLVSIDKAFREKQILLGGPSLTVQMPEKGTLPATPPAGSR